MCLQGTDIVTETDAKAEKAITAAILAAFPDHAVLGEEGGLAGKCERCEMVLMQC